MYRTLTIAALALAFSAAAFGQSRNQPPASGKSEKVLIELSRAFVDSEVGKDMLVATDGVTLTPTGLMGVAEVKGRWDSVELKAPVVRIGSDEAVVTGRVLFKGRLPEGRALEQESGIRIKYVRWKGGWKFVNGCLGSCGSM